MQIWIHDKNMRKVCALNNNVPGMLPYSNSQWHTYLEYSTSTFDFVVPKIVNGKLHDDIKYINDQMYVSFYYDNSYHVFYVAQLIENDTSFQVTCNNTNLELAQEQSLGFKSDTPQNIAWYLEKLGILGFAGLEIGINEVSDKTLTLEFEKQDTQLSQLHSLMSKFDAEFVFKTELNRDGTLKRFVIDIYRQPDENHHGIGKVRGDVVLYYQSGLKGVQVTSDKTQLFNAGAFTGTDGLNLIDVEFEEKNELGQVEFYSKRGNDCVFAPLSRERYPSTMDPNNADNWTRKDFETNYKDVNELKAYALRTIKQYAYPLLTYTVDVQSSFIENYKDINLGDTVKIIDNNFRDGLALEARVSEMIISFDMPLNNSVVFTNFRKLANKPSDALQQRIDEIVAKALPYRVEITTTNGTVFKNGIGRSTVRPVLKQGDKTVNATYRFIINGEIKYAGLTYDVVASDITEPTALTVSAWVDNKEVASEEVTFLNVSDGKDGAKGTDGKTSYVHFAYADSADGTGLTLTDNGQRYMGYYSDYTQADSTDKTKYRWADRLAQADPSDRNLTLNTGYKKNPLGWVQDGVSYEISGDYLKLTLIDPSSDKHIYRAEPFTVTLATGDWINVSYEAYGSKNGIRFRAQTYDTPQVQWKTLTTAPTTYDSAFQLAISRTLSLFIDGDIGDVVYIRFIKTRKGKVMTPWTPAPEDLEDQIDTKADNVLTQTQLNKLNETNSVMKVELEAKASLDTVNQWIKAYQDFVNANSADRAQAQKALADASARVVKLENNLNDMSERWNFIDNYMAASENGLVIGKKDNSSSIMFNPNGRISMFSAGNEVMYISKGVIHIENGIFSKTIQIGRFREEQDYIDPDRNVIRYVGGI